jgi:hypothetical protein
MLKLHGVFSKLLSEKKPSFSTTTPGNSEALWWKFPANGLIHGNQKMSVVKVSNLILANRHYLFLFLLPFYIVFLCIDFCAYSLRFIVCCSEVLVESFIVCILFVVISALFPYTLCRYAFSSFHHLLAEPGYSVGVAMGYGLDGRCSIPGRQEIFRYSTAFTPALGSTQPPIQWMPGALSPGV